MLNNYTEMLNLDDKTKKERDHCITEKKDCNLKGNRQGANGDRKSFIAIRSVSKVLPLRSPFADVITFFAQKLFS